MDYTSKYIHCPRASYPEGLEFLNTQRVCVLAVELLDGSPHAATVHFAHTGEKPVLYFETNKEYRKAEPLQKQAETRGSVVVGTDETQMKTLQMDGVLRFITETERAQFDEVYLGNFPEKAAKTAAGMFILFSFTPTWWRFTDFKTPTGKLIIDSETN